MAESADPYKKKEGKLPNLYNPIDGNRIVRAVPLVYYEGLERHVVGTAILREDGSFTATVDPDAQPRVKEILESRQLSQMAFAFKPPLIDLSDIELERKDKPPLLPPGLDDEGLRKFFQDRKVWNERHLTKEDRPLPDDPAYD